jgi:hypothetical protein
MKRDVDADIAAQLIGTLAGNPIGAVRGLVESAIAIAAPAQRKLGRIADGEIPSDPEVLREALGDLKIVQQLIVTAAEALRVTIEDVRLTSPGGAA